MILSNLIYLAAFVACEAPPGFDSDPGNQRLCDACAAGSGPKVTCDNLADFCTAQTQDICYELVDNCPSGGFTGVGYNPPICCDQWVFETCEKPYTGDYKCNPSDSNTADICSICASGSGGYGCCDADIVSHCAKDPSNVCDVVKKCYDDENSKDPVCCDTWLLGACFNAFGEDYPINFNCDACPATTTSLTSTSSVPTTSSTTSSTTSTTTTSTTSTTTSSTPSSTSSTTTSSITSTTNTSGTTSSSSTTSSNSSSSSSSSSSTTRTYDTSSTSSATGIGSMSSTLRNSSSASISMTSVSSPTSESTFETTSTTATSSVVVPSINPPVVSSGIISSAPAPIEKSTVYTTQPNDTVTAEQTIYTTYCDEPTTLTWGGNTYTITRPTTLTITSCPDKCEEEDITTTLETTLFTTYCPEPTTFTLGDSTYTVTEPTTLTLTTCPEESVEPEYTTSGVQTTNTNTFGTTVIIPKSSRVGNSTTTVGTDIPVQTAHIVSTGIPPVVNEAVKLANGGVIGALAVGLAFLA